MGKNGIERFIRISQNYLDNPDIRKEMLRNVVTKNILDAMEKKEISKAELARKLKTTPSNMSQMLNGNRNLTIDTICEISMALGMMSQISFKDTYEQQSCNVVDFKEEYNIEGYAGGFPNGAFGIVV